MNELVSKGQFENPAFPVPQQFLTVDPNELAEVVDGFKGRFDTFAKDNKNETAYTFDNDYFSSPDAEILYAMVRVQAPETIIEIGCGYSTRVMRLAIDDGGLNTRLVCIDPHPRADVRLLATQLYREPFENISETDSFESLKADDILFIDSSHQVRIGNDVVKIFCHVLPALAPGVIVHVHDIFLPWDYKKEWVVENQWEWNEQYLVQVLLQNENRYEVLWPGYYLQRTWSEFRDHFPQSRGRNAQSLWLRIKA